MSTFAEPSSNKKQTFFHRLNVRFPWLKIFTVCLISLIAIMDLLGFTISKSGDPYNKIKIAPMAKHVRATMRNFEGKMLVALTFDDGPSPSTTPALLDILTEKDVLATFFVLGDMARNNPDIIKRANREGHEIASHTMYHQNLIRISSADVEEDVNEAKSVLKDILGKTPDLTRPPYGNINDAVRTYTATPLILWSVDTLDWKNKNTDSILGITMDQVHDGAIILMHDVHPTSVEAVPVLIDTLRNAGYEFVTIQELIEKRHVELSPGEAYYSFRPE